jgi:GR25 family glycosyltransferase involved in LPS biosynthesis
MVEYECFVINLARQPDKRAAFLQRNGVTGLDFKFFDGIDGNALSDEECVRQGLLKAGAQLYTKGHIGCGASHGALWRHAVATQKNLLIFEDDAYCRHDLEAQLDRVMAGLPGWEIVLLGYNTDAVLDVQVVPHNNFYGFFSTPHPSSQQLDVFAQTTGPTSAFRLNNAFGQAAYMVSPAGAEKLMSVFPMDNRPLFLPGSKPWSGRDTFPCVTIDMLTNTLYRDMATYVLIPPLALPLNDPGTSTTRPR